MKRIDPATSAAGLRALADAVAAGAVRVPAMRYVELNGSTLRVVPRVLHDVLCEVRIATPQEGTDPVVAHCAFCGLCYPSVSVDLTGLTTGVPVDPVVRGLVREIKEPTCAADEINAAQVARDAR
ncbi:hypothetical protein [Micromonospora haikouensis]|uniref:hypothetical protein n=1 Tax=Micromonospora haikouensis TaxID=686309 RepID=UPI003D73DD9D